MKNQQLGSTKSEVFKTAWYIVRNEKKSFSDALKSAWEFSRKIVRMVNISWNKKEVHSFSYSAGNYYSAAASFVTIYIFIKKTLNFNNDGAKYDYGVGKYTGD